MNETSKYLFVCQLTQTQPTNADKFELPDDNSWYVKYLSEAPDCFSSSSEKIKFEKHRQANDIILVGHDSNFAVRSYDTGTTLVESDLLNRGTKDFTNTIIWHDKNKEFYVYHGNTNVFRRIPVKDHAFSTFKIVSKDVIPFYNIKPVIILD